MSNHDEEFSEFGLLEQYSFDIASDMPTVIDVGANRGDFAFPFAKEGWRIVAFEPVPDLVDRLRIRLEEYSGRVSIIQKAVSNTDGEQVTFYVSNQHPGIHALKPFHETHEAQLTVETVRLDSALSNLDIESVELLKIDIEGADFLALQSFDFERFKPEIVMLEMMDKRSQKYFGYTHHDVVAFMRKLNYQAFVSEWSPILQYGTLETHTQTSFLQFASYPLDHEPDWGNLIFVDSQHAHKLMPAYHSSLIALENKLRDPKYKLRKLVKAIPGTKFIYRQLQNLMTD